MLFFFQGRIEDGREVFDAIWPAARAVADEDGSFYHHFGLRRGGLLQLLGPRVVLEGLRAARQGHRAGKRVGDVRLMPGMFLVHGERVRWSYAYRNAGDHPDLASIPRRRTEAPVIEAGRSS